MAVSMGTYHACRRDMYCLKLAANLIDCVLIGAGLMIIKPRACHYALLGLGHPFTEQ